MVWRYFPCTVLHEWYWSELDDSGEHMQVNQAKNYPNESALEIKKQT